MDGASHHARNSSQWRRLNIAYAVTITTNTTGVYLDGLATLAHSVRLTESRHNASLLAFLPPGYTKPHAALAAAGYTILERRVPVARHEIRGEYLRKTIETAGCCGSLELLKLHAYRLVRYDCVLVLDIDTLLLRNMDALFEASVQRGISLAYTMDHAMDNPGSASPPVQGGFLLVRPSIAVYQSLVETVRKGDFREGSGWEGSNIGWCWGGRTIQGLLAFHYQAVAPRAASRRLNACRYNRMHPVDVVRSRRPTFSCSAVPFEQTYSVHFTVCQKPWSCEGQGQHQICRAMHAAWWRVRRALELANGIEPARSCGDSTRAGGKLSYSPLMPRLLAKRELAAATAGPATEMPRHANGHGIHVAFTSSCDKFQYWQTEVVLSSAWHAGHRGPITRIVVGCEDSNVAGRGERVTTTHSPGLLDEKVDWSLWHRTSYPNTTVHFAPAAIFAKRFPWFNKPWGLAHWASNGRIMASTVAIIDPDQWFLAPLTQGVLPRGVWLLDPSWKASEVADDVARPGRAVAQKYGLGDSLLRKIPNRQKICGEHSWCATMSGAEVQKHFSNGPPYLVHAADFSRLMERWWRFMRPAYEQDPGDIQLDMYAYSMAAADLGIGHVTVQHHMVSSPDVYDEGWAAINELSNVRCSEAGRASAAGHAWAAPTFTHACHNYHALATGGPLKGAKPEGQLDERLWVFHKGHVPPQIFECEHPLLQMPPEDLFNVQTTARRRRRAFMLCVLHRQVNEAATDYKRKYCPPERTNLRECVRITRSDEGDAVFPRGAARRVTRAEKPEC